MKVAISCTKYLTYFVSISVNNWIQFMIATFEQSMLTECEIWTKLISSGKDHVTVNYLCST